MTTNACNHEGRRDTGDFIVKGGLAIKELILVCWDSSSIRTRKRETKALLKASRELQCNKLLVITGGYEDEERAGNKTIVYTPLWKWPLHITNV